MPHRKGGPVTHQTIYTSQPVDKLKAANKFSGFIQIAPTAVSAVYKQHREFDQRLSAQGYTSCPGEDNERRKKTNRSKY